MCPDRAAGVWIQLALIYPGFKVYVRCPECLGELRSLDDKVACANCGKRYNVRDGIPVLSNDKSFYYEFAGLERGEMQKILQEIDQDGFPTAVQDFLKQCDSPRASAYYRNVFQAERAAWKLMLAFPDHARALDLGAGSGVVSVALSPHCESVVACDLTLERLGFLKRWAEHENLSNISYACCGDTTRLPFATDEFDVIVLNGVLEWIPSGRSGNPRKCQQEFLDEIRRALKPSGQVYIGIENRIGYPYFFGKREDHTGIRFLSLLPRFVARAIHRWKRGSDFRVYTYTGRGLERLLNSAGFDDVTLYSPFPDYRDFEELIPLDGVCRVTPPPRRSRLKSLLHQVACHPKTFRHLSPTYATVAGSKRNGSKRNANTLLMEVADALQLAPESPALGGLRVSQTGMVVGRARHRDGTPSIVRLAISNEGRARCELNYEALRVIQEHSNISERTRQRIPAPMGRVEIKGQLATAETLLPGRATHIQELAAVDAMWSDLAETIENIALVRVQPNSALGICFEETVNDWSSAVQRHLPKDTTGCGQADRIGQIGTWLISHGIESAFVHGNCHVGNVLIDERTNRLTGLFDWDLASGGQLPFMDLFEFAVAPRYKSGDGIEAWLARIVPRFHDTLERLAPMFGLPTDYAHILEIAFLLRLAAQHVRLPLIGPDQLHEMQRIVGLIISKSQRQRVV